MSFQVDEVIEQLRRFELIREGTIKEITERMKDIFIDEPNVQHIKSPVTIVTDLHGQLMDLLEMFRVGGSVPDVNYIFCGNYVNRGIWSVETFILLCCLKMKHPLRVTLLRGSHESRTMTHAYGLYEECIRKYGSAVIWNYLLGVFECLPISAIVDEKIMCIHGGISPSIATVDQMRVMQRFKDNSKDPLLIDLMYSDPEPEKEGFFPSPRGGFLFGQDALSKFLKTNRLDKLIRGHQLCLDGYQVIFQGKLITMWTAPNFLGRIGNIGCIAELSEGGDIFYNTFTGPPVSLTTSPPYDPLKVRPDYYGSI